MEIWETDIKACVAATMEWKDIVLMPLGDVQLGALGCDEDKFRRHIEWGIKNDALFLGMGDYVDVASPSNRMNIKSIELYDSVHDALEQAAQSAVQRFLHLVEGTKGRWLGMLEGHHFWEFADGTTSDTRIAQALAAPFLGNCAFVRLRFNHSKTSMTKYTVWCHHGVGGGMKVSAPLNRLENLLAHHEANMYLIGHHHKKVVAEIPRMYMTERKPYTIGDKPQIIACTGSFLKGYMAGSHNGNRPMGSYVEKKMLNPVGLGGLVFTLHPHASNSKIRIDVGWSGSTGDPM